MNKQGPYKVPHEICKVTIEKRRLGVEKINFRGGLENEKFCWILSAGVLLLVVKIPVLASLHTCIFHGKMFKQILDDTVKGMKKDKKMLEEMSKWRH